MPTPAPPAAAARFASIIDLLCRSVAARIAGGGLAGPLILLIWARLRRMGVRFAAVAARAEAGTLRPAAVRRRPARPRPAVSRPSPLPRSAAWLVRLVPQAASGASQLQSLLAEPEMAALIAAAPQTGRILRPLCRMLGVRPPAILRLPPAGAAMAAPAPQTAGQLPPAASPPDPPRRRHRMAPPPPRPVLMRICGPPGATSGV